LLWGTSFVGSSNKESFQVAINAFDQGGRWALSFRCRASAILVASVRDPKRRLYLAAGYRSATLVEPLVGNLAARGLLVQLERVYSEALARKNRVHFSDAGMTAAGVASHYVRQKIGLAPRL